jgi:hypothetical protein
VVQKLETRLIQLSDLNLLSISLGECRHQGIYFTEKSSLGTVLFSNLNNL